MNTAFIIIYVSGFLLIGMLVIIDLGYRIGRRRRARNPDASTEGTGAVDAAVFGLLGLALAFTFGGASDRLTVRRAQIVQEANAIGTAYLRVDMLPPAEQPPIRALFRQYLESRIEVFEKILDRAASNAALNKSNQIQREIWFALAISSTVYVVLDLEYPRAGLITLTSMDWAIVELRGMMK